MNECKRCKMLEEVAKSKTPSGLTLAEIERLTPPVVWVSKEMYDELKNKYNKLVKEVKRNAV